MRILRSTGLLAVLGLASAPALADDQTPAASPVILASQASFDGLAQDEDEDEDSVDDDLDDILGGGREDTVKDEIEAVRTGEIGDKVGARQEDVVLIDDGTRKKRLIKTLQRKTFLKLGRWEVSPHAAFVANDPFLNRYIVGSGVGYHVTEIFEIEGSFDFAPDLGDGDWKPLTKQLVEENHVSPDISKLTAFGSVTFNFSPIYGKVAVVGKNIINFDIYGGFGMGATRTADDLDALQAQGDPRAEATQFQVHPTTNYGGGVRIVFNQNMAARVEGRSMVYIETVNATTLEMKQNFILQGAVSFFIPNMRG